MLSNWGNTLSEDKCLKLSEYDFSIYSVIITGWVVGDMV